jgi:hypothetical protein
MPLGEQVSDQTSFTLFADEASSLERQFERRLPYIAALVVALGSGLDLLGQEISHKIALCAAKSGC